MLIEGVHECKRCKNTFEWYEYIPQRKEEANWSKAPTGKVSVTVFTRHENMIPNNVRGTCPIDECGQPNVFDVDYKNVKITK
ncbi:MAG: hypothetical protein K0S34_104 [Bacillales bacterium]|jgi:hypothetical protein|nr:hypothetical protein [Bacillales bacterium]